MKEVTRLEALEGGIILAVWGAASDETFAKDASGFISRLGLKWDTITALKGSPDSTTEDLIRLVKTATQAKPVNVYPWFAVGLYTMAIVGLNFPELRDRLNIKEPGKEYALEQQIWRWRFVVQNSGIELSEIQNLQTALRDLASSSDFAQKGRNLTALLERLREQAIRRDESEKTRGHMEPTVQANLYRGDIGAVNLGKITGNIYSSTTILAREPAAQNVAAAIQGMTQAIEQDPHLQVEQKIEALQAVETLSEQARLDPAQRRPGTFKAALIYLPTLLSSVVSATKIWETFGPAIENYFHTL